MSTPAVGAAARRSMRASRVAPFLAAMLIGQASAALPPGPVSTRAYAASCALLAATLVVGAFLPRLPPGFIVVPPVTYAVSSGFLAMSDGGASSGTSALVLLPIVWAALFAGRVTTAVVVVTGVATELVVSVSSNAPVAVDVRRLILWGFLGTMVAVAITGLREGLARTLDHSMERQRQSEVLTAAASELAVARTRRDALQTAVQRAVGLASPVMGRYRAAYYGLRGDTVSVVADAGVPGAGRPLSFTLADHPFFRDIAATGLPLAGAFEGAEVGVSVRRFLNQEGITGGMGVPVRLDDHIDGILAVATRERRFPEELFDRFVALGRMLEMALGDIAGRERLARLAQTDQLTGLYNRRGLDEALLHRGRRRFSFIVVDIDDLKAINDARGHEAGDAVIVATASALRGALRSGEIVARTGGDEFVVFLGGTSHRAALATARRLLDAVRMSTADGVTPRVSVGVATGRGGSPPAEVLQRADQAMYEAKRLGGMQVADGGPSAGAAARGTGASPYSPAWREARTGRRR